MRNDSLFWELPAVSCGPVMGYEIYGALDQDGPYSVLDTVSDPSGQVFYHNNPTGDTYFYFLQTIAECPGEQILPSDTLDNLPPERSPIRFVSVDGDDVLIEWEPVGDPDVIGYVVYRNTSVGTVPIDTVYSGNSYTDSGADPEIQIEYYYINALDACGNASFFDEAHHTILLSYSIDSCEQAALLQWNAYDTWPEGVESYFIRLTVDGGVPYYVDTVSGGITTYTLEDLDKNSSYELEVVAKRNGRQVLASSNTIDFQPDIVQTVRDLNLFNASVQNSNVILEWTWDPSAELESVQVEVYVPGSGLQQVIDTDIPAQGLQVLHQFTVGGINPASNPYSFELLIIDRCGKEIRSGRFSTIFLRGELRPDNSTLLGWDPVSQSRRTLDLLDLYLEVDGSSQLLRSLNVTSTQALDNAQYSETPCYQLYVEGTVALSDGTVYGFEQLSNEVCVARKVKVYLPNALSPLGVNNVYKPALINRESVAEYSLRIFDRWGNQVFFSNVPEFGWDGISGGKRASEGLYVYQLEIVQIDGSTLKRSGSIHLLY